MSTVNNQSNSAQQAKRLVVFAGGFDPRGARHYHQLMRREASKQSAIASTQYQVGRRGQWSAGAAAGLSHSTWTVTGTHGVDCDYLFLDWSDLVRNYWPQQTWRVIAEGWRTYAAVARVRSTLPPVHRQTPYVLWTLAYPLVYMLLCFIVALMCAAFTIHFIPGVQGLILGGIAAAVVILGGYRLDRLLHVSWLLRILNFSRLYAQKPVPALHERWEKTAHLLAEQLQRGSYQEVLVVGFSVGSAMAVPFVHALRHRLRQQPQGPQSVQMLTLGNCIPLFTLMPQGSVELREQLFALAQDRDLYWVDISSPSDSVSFGMCDLIALSLPGMPSSNLQQCVNPRHMCSPRFHKLFQPSTYRWLRRNKMRMHFQYLMASELPGAYDYFALLTAKVPFMDFVLKRLVR